MKKLLIIMAMLVCSNAVLAEETVSLSEQKVELQDNKATFAMLKQPTNDNSKQEVIVKNNWFSFVVVLNGKTPFDKADN